MQTQTQTVDGKTITSVMIPDGQYDIASESVFTFEIPFIEGKMTSDEIARKISREAFINFLRANNALYRNPKISAVNIKENPTSYIITDCGDSITLLLAGFYGNYSFYKNP